MRTFFNAAVHKTPVGKSRFSSSIRKLAGYTDLVAQAYPGIGVGYYDRELDAIITYGPSKIYADKVGLPISASHEGRIVMNTGLPRIQEGDLVRGPIMNAMHPVVRNHQVIGYIWANELTVDIEAQLSSMLWQIAWTILACLIIGSVGVNSGCWPSRSRC